MTRSPSSTLSAFAALLLATSAVVAADFHEGLAAHARGDYERALREWRPLAEGGYIEAQYRLGRMYYHGEGVRDDAEAFRWYRLAAEQGHAKAQNNLALMYETGRGVEPDLEQAASWYRASAEQGLAAAQANLGRLYAAGQGVARDPVAAARWYRNAGAQGHARSQYRLALMYDEGDGVPGNVEKAAGWYLKAARRGSGPAQAAIGSMYASGRGVRRNLKKAARWLGRASAQGIVVDSGVAGLGSPVGIEWGEATPVDAAAAPETAVVDAPAEDAAPERPALAAADETTDAVGPSGSPGPDAASTTVEDAPPPEAPVRAAEPPEPTAAPPRSEPSPPPEAPVTPPVDASRTPRRGGDAGQTPDYPRLREAAERAEAGDAEAQYRLANMHATGTGAPESMEDAALWYLAAAERGHVMAAYKLGMLYLRGRGVPRRDWVQAYKWFTVAAAADVGDAAAWTERIRDKMTSRELAESEAAIAEWQAREPK